MSTRCDPVSYTLLFFLGGGGLRSLLFVLFIFRHAKAALVIVHSFTKRRKRNKTDFEPNYCEAVNKCTDKGSACSSDIEVFVCINQQLTVVKGDLLGKLLWGQTIDTQG